MAHLPSPQEIRDSLPYEDLVEMYVHGKVYHIGSITLEVLRPPMNQGDIYALAHGYTTMGRRVFRRYRYAHDHELSDLIEAAFNGDEDAATDLVLKAENEAFRAYIDRRETSYYRIR